MIRKFNFHTHTSFCDGHGMPGDFVEAALEYDLMAIGFSGHAPVPFKSGHSMEEKDVEAYCELVREQKALHEDQINIYLGLEFDFIPGITHDFNHTVNKYKLDYSIGSVHLVKNPEMEDLWFIDGPDPAVYDNGIKQIFNGDACKAVETYYGHIIKMVETQRPTIIGHLDKVKMHNKQRFFDKQDKWYLNQVGQTLEVIRSNKCIVEVNTRGIYKKRCNELFPGTDILKMIRSMNIPVTISTDAHKPEETDCYFEDSLEVLLSVGFREVMILADEEWKKVPIL